MKNYIACIMNWNSMLKPMDIVQFDLNPPDGGNPALCIVSKDGGATEIYRSEQPFDPPEPLRFNEIRVRPRGTFNLVIHPLNRYDTNGSRQEHQFLWGINRRVDNTRQDATEVFGAEEEDPEF